MPRPADVFRVVQLILLIPSTLSLGLAALFVGVGAPLSILGWALSDQNVEWKQGLAASVLSLANVVLFLIPGVGFVLLWILILKGTEWMARRRKLAFTTIVIGSISCGLGLWMGLTGTRESHSIGMASLFLIPVAIGVLNLTLLGAALVRSRAKSSHH